MPINPNYKACCVSETTPILDPNFDKDAMEMKKDLLKTSADAPGIACPDIALDGFKFASSA